jgi:hypothetical protein
VVEDLPWADEPSVRLLQFIHDDVSINLLQPVYAHLAATLAGMDGANIDTAQFQFGRQATHTDPDTQIAALQRRLEVTTAT